MSTQLILAISIFASSCEIPEVTENPAPPRSRFETSATDVTGHDLHISPMNWLKEYWRCPVCDSDRRIDIGRRGGQAHRDGLGVETMIVKCVDCSARYAYPTLIPEGNPYEDEPDYFKIHDPDAVKRRGQALIARAESLLGRVGSMLEIGCGRGLLLSVAKQRGWDVRGIEMTQQFAEQARLAGIDVDLSSIEDAKLGTYDVILCPAILEHLYRPVEVLKKMSAALVPGGLLFIDIPNETSLTMTIGNLYSRPWSINLSPTFSPYHVVGFTPRSIRKALDLAGLSIREIEMIKYANVLPSQTLRRKVEKLGLGIVQWIGSAIGRGDGLVIWAQKN